MKKRMLTVALVCLLVEVMCTGRVQSQTTSVNPGDSLALVALYAQCNGPHWNNRTNWLTGKVNTWAGVTVIDGRVTRLYLGNYSSPDANKLTGQIPAEIGNLTELVSLDLWANFLTGSVPVEIQNLTKLESLFLQENDLTFLPDLAALIHLSTINLSFNRLSFNSLVQFGNNRIPNQGSFLQKTMGTGADVDASIGQDYSFDGSLPGDGNVYHWFFNGTPLGATSNLLELKKIQAEQLGQYNCRVTNPGLPSLTLYLKSFLITNGLYPPSFLYQNSLSGLNSMTFSWNRPEQGSPSTYKVYRNGSLYSEITKNEYYLPSTFTDNAVSPGSTYTYKVTAAYEGTPAGESTATNILTIVYNNSINYLDINNCNVPFRSNGHSFTSTDGVSSGFEVPRGSGKTSVYAGDLWLGSMVNDALYLSAMKFSYDKGFLAGPVCTSGGQTTSGEWDRVWKVSRKEIDEHKAKFSQAGYSMPYDIQGWPAHGDASRGMAARLAPFEDVNKNGKYEPALGDYPIIKGDQAVYLIFNDNDPGLTPGGNHFGFEFHLMAYAYDRPNDSLKNNTIFMNYRIFNRGSLKFDNVRLGVYADFDLGYGMDDYIGCDTVRNLYFVYNDDVDGVGEAFAYGSHPPAQGVVFLDRRMESFIGYMNGGGILGDPYTSGQFWNYLNSTWLDGEHLRTGGNGHTSGGGSEQLTNYLFPGNPSDPAQWSALVTEPTDRRGVGIISFSLAPGEEFAFEIAHVFAWDESGTNLTSVGLLKQRVDLLLSEINGVDNEFYSSEGRPKLAVWPNPAGSRVTIRYTLAGDQPVVIQVVDYLGRVVKELESGTQNAGEHSLSWDTGALVQGIYYLRLKNTPAGFAKMVISR